MLGLPTLRAGTPLAPHTKIANLALAAGHSLREQRATCRFLQHVSEWNKIAEYRGKPAGSLGIRVGVGTCFVNLCGAFRMRLGICIVLLTDFFIVFILKFTYNKVSFSWDVGCMCTLWCAKNPPCTLETHVESKGLNFQF